MPRLRRSQENPPTSTELADWEREILDMGSPTAHSSVGVVTAAEYQSVNWEPFEIPQARPYPTIQFTGSSQFGIDFDPTVARLRDAMRAQTEYMWLISTAATQAAQSMQAVGNPNNEREGDNMPEVGIASEPTETVVIPVPPTVTDRLNTFNTMGLSTELVADPSSAAWLDALTRFESSCTSAAFTVGVGGFSAGDELPRFGNRTPDWVNRDIAERYIEAASAGSLRVVDTDENQRRSYNMLSIEPTSGQLEVDALRTYFGASPAMDTMEDADGSVMANVTSLRSLVRIYGEFRVDYRREYIRQALRNRRNQQVSQPAVMGADPWTDDRIRKFEKFLTGVTAKLNPEVDPFLKLPILPHKTLSSRNWGIEIEAVHIDGIETPAGWQLKGDGSLRDLSQTSLPSRSLAHDTTCPSLTLTSDMECDCSMNRNQRNTSYTEVGEWNSPVLKSYHSRGLKYLTGELGTRRTNHSAGIHVHVEAHDLTPSQAVLLSIVYTALEPLFRKEYHRNGTRQYCQPVAVDELIKRFRQARKVKAEGRTVRDMSFGSRYWTVNLASLQGKGTVEFRAMGPKYDYEHLVRWAYFCREMVNLAKADVPQKVWAGIRTIEDLIVVFSKYGKETPTPTWAASEPVEDATEQIVAVLGVENRRAPNVTHLVPNDASSLEVYFDDYTAAEPVFASRRGRNSF